MATRFTLYTCLLVSLLSMGLAWHHKFYAILAYHSLLAGVSAVALTVRRWW